MSSPHDSPSEPRPDLDHDEQMQDAVPVQNETEDQEMTTQNDTQPTSGIAAHHNRKDVSLREFLSKMDDYAPIVSASLTFNSSLTV
jgi:hypothetical protein